MLCGAKMNVPVSPAETAFAVDKAMLMSTARSWVVVSKAVIVIKIKNC